MDKMKVKILDSHSTTSLEREIESWIDFLQKDNKIIVDIKFGGFNYNYSAMIIYK